MKPYIPEDAKWYIAQVIEKITVGGDPRIVCHINFNLIRADSPEEAYSKALEVGRQCSLSYKNIAGKKVRISFVGLRDLCVIHDELEHGEELLYTEFLTKDERRIDRQKTPKGELSVFAQRKRRRGARPDYVAADIVRDLQATGALSLNYGKPQKRRGKTKIGR